MPNPILDPTGRSGRGTGAASGAGLALAGRRAGLRGATVGLLENTKQNADLFLAELGRLLVERHGVANLVPRTKRAFAAPVSEDLRKELARTCDVVITGVGDCGSCSASAVADGVSLEREGIPTAVICSDAFVSTADAMAGVQGAVGYRYVTTPHPVAVLSPEEVRERALRVLPEVLQILLGDAVAARPDAA